MKKTDDSRGGIYLHTSVRHRKVVQFIIFGLVILVGATIIGVKKWNEKSRTTYHLPDEIPNVSIPNEFSEYSGSQSLEKVVVPYFDFSMKAGQDTIEINLPIIKADFGENFNIEVSKRLDTLIHNILFYLDRNESYFIREMSYESYLDRDVLSILIWTHYTDGQSKCEPWLFDLADGGRPHDTWEWTDKLLEMNYSSFLWVTDRHVQNAFSKEYQESVNSIPESGMSEEQQAFIESYNGILQEIPHDTVNALNRWIFPADGKVYLIYELPLVTDDWYAGLRTETRIDDLDSTTIQYQRMVTNEDMIRDVISNMTIHVMGGTDQAHAMLVRYVFYSSPEAFIKSISDAEEQNHVIDSLLLYVDDIEETKIMNVCRELKAENQLDEDELVVINLIISRIEN